MKVIFDERFFEVYAGDPAAEKGRLGPAVKRLREAGHEFEEPQPARDEDILRVHTKARLRDVQRDDRIYKMALLAAGGTLQAARIAMDGEPAFALVRPPGHHASPDHCWGFCFFNNAAVAVAALLDEGAVDSALVLDIDLHFGDGSENFFGGLRGRVEYLHPEGRSNDEWLDNCRSMLFSARRFDLIAVSAGFDRHVRDWGDLLDTEAYRTVGRWVRELAGRHASGRRFAVLEGGYNPDSLAEAAEALLDGMG